MNTHTRTLTAAALGLAVIGAPTALATSAQAEEVAPSVDTAQTSPQTEPSSTTPAPETSASTTTPTATTDEPSSASDDTAAAPTSSTSSGSSSSSDTPATSTGTSSPSGTPSTSSPSTPVTADPKPTSYVAALWLIPGGDISQPFAQPQRLVKSVPLSKVDEAGAIALTADGVKCGSAYQLDVYLDDDTTAALVKGGILTGVNNPTEHLATPSSFEVFTSDACAPTPPVNPTPPVTPAPPVKPAPPVTPAPPVVTPPAPPVVVTPPAKVSPPTPVVKVAAVRDVPAPAAPTSLAYTGSEGSVGAGWAGGAFVALGGALIGGSKLIRRLRRS